MLQLLCIILFLAFIAYVVTYMKLPEPYGKLIQIILLVLVIVAVGQFATGGAVNLRP